MSIYCMTTYVNLFSTLLVCVLLIHHSDYSCHPAPLNKIYPQLHHIYYYCLKMKEIVLKMK